MQSAKNVGEVGLSDSWDTQVCVEEAFADYAISRDNAGKLRLLGDGVSGPRSGLAGMGFAKGEDEHCPGLDS